MAATPNFTSTPRSGITQVSTANTARDGTGTAPQLLAAVAAGTLVWRVFVYATGTTTAGMVRLFHSTDNGTTKRLIDELPVSAITPSATAVAWSGRFRTATYQTPIVLGASTNNGLWVSTHNAETFNVYFEAADLT